MKDNRRAGSSDPVVASSLGAEARSAKAAPPAVAVHAALDRLLVERLHRKAGADRWTLPIEAFAAALEMSARKAFASGAAEPRQVERYLESLHLEDLALACACAQGSESAWEHFMREQRPVLYRAADAIDPSGGSRDLADSLYGELFGLEIRDGERRSHFRYFHGRSSLATWLRAVLSQRHVDRIRAVRRHDPLPEDESPGAIPAPRDEADPERAGHVSVMRRCVSAAVAKLAPRDRLRLRCYYAQDLTLSQIGRALNESEATASRHLSRIRRDIRAAVERELREQHMSDAEIAECFASLVADSATLDLAEMLGSDPGSDPTRKDLGPDRSKGKEKSRAMR
jgi:RNA polymerase sigma-70 factor, ECF subfamily